MTSSQKKNNNDKKNISGKNVAVIFLIILALFGAYCFIHFAYQATKYGSDETSQSESYEAAQAE